MKIGSFPCLIMLARTQTRFHAIHIRLENYTLRKKNRRFLWEFFLFGFEQGWACLFGGIMLFLLLATKWLWPHDTPLARYDFLFLSALAVQAALLLLRMETVREAKIIFIFHLVGTFTSAWLYPHQAKGWEMVHFGKYGSWFLLMIISFILVSFVHPPKAPERKTEKT